MVEINGVKNYKKGGDTWELYKDFLIKTQQKLKVQR